MTTELITQERNSRYRSATNPVERTRWHILWLMKEGHTAEEVAVMLGYTARWIRTIVQRWNRGGEPAILDHRRLQKGAPPLLSPEQQKELDQALDQPPADGGLWSGPKVAAWMAQGWAEAPACPVRTMSRARKPSKRLLKKLPEEVNKLAEAYPQARVELWSQDEHRIGLKPILRRVWARKGSRVRAVVRPCYQWMYLYGFVEPKSGKTSWLLMPTVNTHVFALASFCLRPGTGRWAKQADSPGSGSGRLAQEC